MKAENSLGENIDEGSGKGRKERVEWSEGTNEGNEGSNEASNEASNEGSKYSLKLLMVIVIICITSFQVYYICVVKLEHHRNISRSLNYHVLKHQIIALYWFGQEMLNYPIMQYYQLPGFQSLLGQIRHWFGNLDSYAYGMVDQQQVNATTQKIYVEDRTHHIHEFNWTLETGFIQPFQEDNITSIKNVLLNCSSIRIELQSLDITPEHHWNILFVVEPFSDASIVVRLYAREIIDLQPEHYASFFFGLLLAAVILYQFIHKPSRRLQNLSYYFVSFMLVYSSILSFSQQFSFEWIVILDGIACLCAWLCALKFTAKEDDYHISFLLKKSYITIGRLFASFGPLLIAFSIFGYCCFCRYSAQFSSFHRTFMSIFYICYYNMTYESMIVTGRSNLSMIFFMLLVLIFTMCIYSGMLVSVFCSYVWSKRQEKIKEDIVNNLKIQCTSCDYKYKYVESIKKQNNPKLSMNISQLLEINFRNIEECAVYKRVIRAKMERLRNHAENVIENIGTTYFSINLRQNHYYHHQYQEMCWKIKAKVKSIMEKSLQEGNALKSKVS